MENLPLTLKPIVRQADRIHACARWHLPHRSSCFASRVDGTHLSLARDASCTTCHGLVLSGDSSSAKPLIQEIRHATCYEVASVFLKEWFTFLFVRIGCGAIHQDFSRLKQNEPTGCCPPASLHVYSWHEASFERPQALLDERGSVGVMPRLRQLCASPGAEQRVTT